jgi:hypothetical protein
MMSAAKIHLELRATVYGQNVMREGTVRQWCGMFKDVLINVHDEEQNGRPSVVGADLFKVLAKKFVKNGASQFQKFRVNFHQFHAVFSMRLS